ncbi:helix-turn-helix transcriptional regulator [Streptomyces indicus]|uniref:helix-turn-helix transcriptional regulator n=1 Tax=Streptomyces indicus TaxID=417292 RepID=UPI000B89E6D9|nr:helix-turn-helix transcriptional regulator [Streptomyces indicus]
MPVDPIPEWVLQRRREIGSRVRDARSERGLTQEELGHLVGLDRKTVNRLETGAYSTLLDHLLLIAKELRVPAADLLR